MVISARGTLTDQGCCFVSHNGCARYSITLWVFGNRTLHALGVQDDFGAAVAVGTFQ